MAERALRLVHPDDMPLIPAPRAGAPTLRDLSILGMAQLAQNHVDTFTGWCDHRPPLTTPWCPIFTSNEPSGPTERWPWRTSDA